MSSTGLRVPWLGTVLVLCSLSVPMPVAAVDAAMLEGGWTGGEADAERYGGYLRWELRPQWFRVGDWYMGSYVELGMSYWDGKSGKSGHDNLVDFSLTPVFRYQQEPKQGIAPFVEFGVGAHVYTHDGIGDKEFDIPFAFGTHVGLGVRFGDAGRYELLYRFQHQSNARLGDENPGINFHNVQIGLHF